MRTGLLVLVIGLAGCAAPTMPPAPIVTAWGNVQMIAEVPNADAPALLTGSDQRWLAWTEVRDGDNRHMTLRDATPTILALRAWFPFGYTLLSAGDDKAHWLWLDRTADSDSLRLQSALVSADRVAEVGPIVLSRGLTTRYSAVALAQDKALIVWSEGAVGATMLNITQLDAAGRPPFAEPLGIYGNYPTLTRTREGVVWLYWLQDGVWRARLEGTQATDIRRLMDAPILSVSDRLEALTAAQDDTHTYLFWQVVDRVGQPRTLMSSALSASPQWTDPQPLQFGIGERPFVTTYNGGSAQAVIDGTLPTGWARPVAEQQTVLPVAVTWGNRLGVLYFQGGRTMGVQDLLGAGTLFSAPQIASDRDRHLTLTWSQPVNGQTARLLLLSTRP